MEEIKNHIKVTEGEVGALDVLVTLAENIKLLLVVPLLVGLCALGICFMVPQSYQ
ncbi:MAG: lipopolysaccharide biosynthesis, partial [Polaromonas sp.]|nr:lipopolysaccharide biosynthesis [Polaromonas sp.]